MRINATLRQIEVFLAVARSLSFTRAAEEMHMSQPALSATIRRLEDELGARLLDRTSRNVELSPAGSEFVAIAEEIVETFDTALGRMEAFIDGKRGKLSIAASPSVMATIVPSALVELRSECPGIAVEVHEVLFEECIALLRAGRADVALTPQKVDADDLEQHELFEDELVVLCAEDHALAAADAVKWSELLRYPQIVLRHASSVRQMVDAEFNRRGARLRAAFEVDRISSMIGFVAAGLGVGLIPHSFGTFRDLQGVACRRLADGTAKRTICVTTLRWKASSPASLSFTRICSRTARQLQWRA